MRTLNQTQLKAMNDEQHRDFILINVLSRDAFNEQHIRTSINIPHTDDNFTETVEKVAGSKDREIVVYCADSDCDASHNAAKKLEKAGFSEVCDFAGGTQEWFYRNKAA